MSFDFLKKVIGGTSDTTFNFGRKFILGGSGGEPSYIDVILSGVSPLTLTKAKSEGLNYVKALGKCEQTNLPSGYTQLKYVQNGTSATKINTGVMPETGDELEIRFITPYTATVSNYLIQSRESNNAGIYGISGSQSGNTIIFSWGSGISITSNITRELDHEYIVRASVTSTALTMYVKDVTTGTEDTVTRTITSPSDTNSPYFIWGNGVQALSQTTPVYYARIKNNGVTKLNYVAAKDSNNSASFYDLVNDTFITTFDGRIEGSEDVATPMPDVPINIVSNNGVLKVSPNLFDISKAVRGDILSATGDISTTILYRIVSDFIPVSAGQSYSASGKICFEGDTNDYDVRLIIAYYDSNKGYISGSRTTSLLEFTVPDNGASYIRVEYWGDLSSGYTVDTVRSKLQFELGTTATAYMPYGQIYTDGTTETITDSLSNSATAEMLLAIDNFKDIQSVLDGTITRNIGIKVLDGSEDWKTVEQTGGRYRYKTRISNVTTGLNVSNYFEGDKPITEVNSDTTITEACVLFQKYLYIYTKTFATVTDFTSWLSNQYSNGTPFILVYPLETATTETVTAQTLSTESGTNTITATGSLPNLELEVSFKQKS